MKKRIKKTTRTLFALLAVLVLLMSVPVSVFAATGDRVKLQIDLRNCPVSFYGTKKYDSDSTPYTAQAGELNTVEFEVGGSYEFLKLTLNQDPVNPVREWEVNGTRYDPLLDYTEDENDGEIIHLHSRGMTLIITTESIVFRAGGNDSLSTTEWTIKPIVAASSEIEAKVETNDSTQGSVTAVKQTAENTYKLKATANPGYSFDHWVAASTQEEIAQNPYTVTLTASETYTAYFHEWKTATVSTDPKGLVRSDGTDAVTAARKWDDTWTLTAYGAVLGDRNYAFSHWSCDEDSSFKSEKNPLDVELTENRHYVAHYIPWQITGLTGIRAGGSSDWATTEKGAVR